VLGVDACQEALDAARGYTARRGLVPPRVHLEACDVRRLPVADGSLDAVVDVMTSQHLPWSQHAALHAEYRRALRPGGWLFIYTLGRGTTLTGARRLETFTYDHLPAVFPGVGPVCLPQGPALSAALSVAGFHPSPVRQLSRTYSSGAVTTYLLAEATAV
jgi:SAM-dependent methyltransferase